VKHGGDRQASHPPISNGAHDEVSATESNRLENGKTVKMVITMKTTKPVYVEFTNQGTTLRGELFRPDGDGPYPAVILLHGFISDRRDMARPARELAARGIAALTFDLRGHGQSDGLYAEDPVGDVLAARVLLAGQPRVDPARIAVVGHSMGGRLALLAAAQERSIAAVAALAPAPDSGGKKLLQVLDRLPPNRDGTVYYYPDTRQMPGMDPFRNAWEIAYMRRKGYRAVVDWQRIAYSWAQQPLASIMASISPRPVLLLQCLWDDKVPLRETLALYRRAKQPRTLIVSPWGVHSTATNSALLRRLWTRWLARSLMAPESEAVSYAHAPEATETSDTGHEPLPTRKSRIGA